jgi:nucleoside-diphosphate-sugar epimerase
MDKMILVTGGTGLLGSHLLYKLVQDVDRLVAVKRPSSDLNEVRRVFAYYGGDTDKFFGKIRWVDADLLNQADMEEVLEGVDRVYHVAAMVSFQPRDRRKMIRFNTDAGECLVNACLSKGVEKLIHVSSTSAIGRPPEGSYATESMIWSPTKTSTGYAESKFRSEMEVWRGMEEGLKAVIVNPSIILGSGFWKRGSSSMISQVAGGLRYGTPGITGYVGVDDVASILIQLMNSDISGERFILNEGNYSYLEIFGMMAEALGSDRELKEVSPALLKNLARLDALAGLFTGKRRLTSEHISAAFGEIRFSSEKVRTALNMEFTPIAEVIEEQAKNYRKDFPG